MFLQSILTADLTSVPLVLASPATVTVDEKPPTISECRGSPEAGVHAPEREFQYRFYSSHHAFD